MKTSYQELLEAYEGLKHAIKLVDPAEIVQIENVVLLGLLVRFGLEGSASVAAGMIFDGRPTTLESVAMVVGYCPSYRVAAIQELEVRLAALKNSY